MTETTGLADLERRLDPADVLDAVFTEIAGSLGADRAGVAMHTAHADFEVVALADRTGKAVTSRYRFAAENTTGAWVAAHGVPFVGKDTSDLTAHPRTLDYMLRERFGSNCVVPIELGRVANCRSGVLFFLSRRREAFCSSSLTLALRVREIVEPSLRAHLAVNDLRHGSPTPNSPAPASETKPATLEEIEHAHIVRTLRHANWVIEGPRGAAASLGLNPSTLRNRMRKLGISRSHSEANTTN